MKTKVLLALSGLFLLQSCMIYDMLQEKPSEDGFFKESTVEEPIEEIKSGHPPLLVLGMSSNKLYAGMPNEITIYAEGGSTAHLEVSTTAGRLDTIDKAQGKYSFFEQAAGFKTEIVAKDLVTGQMAVKVFDIINLPAPNAYIWKHKTVFKGQVNFTAEQFKQQTAIVLQHDNMNAPSRCAASSYTMIRIDENGKRQTCQVADRSGSFNEEGKKLIGEAKKGDIYIFKAIKTDCSTEPVKDIVYTIE